MFKMNIYIIYFFISILSVQSGVFSKTHQWIFSKTHGGETSFDSELPGLQKRNTPGLNTIHFLNHTMFDMNFLR